MSHNSLLTDSALPLFADFQPAEVEPAIDLLLARCEAALERVTRPDMPADYERIVAVLAVPLEALSEAWGTVTHLKDMADTPALRQAVEAAQPRVAAFYARLASNERLFELHRRVEREASATLSAPQRKELADTLRDFRLSGAELPPAQKARFVEISQRLAELGRRFSQHVLDATDAYAYLATAEEVAGLPEHVQQRLAAAAAQAGHEGRFQIGLDAPTVGPILRHAHSRTLRARVHHANAVRASELDRVERDNGPLIAEIVALRQERAALLGLGSFAELSLASKMAESPQQVMAFLRDLARRARQGAEAELAELRRFAHERLGLASLEAWDLGYAAEALRQHSYAFSEDEVRQHLRLPDVMQGLMGLAEQLFGVRFSPAAEPAWHPDVTCWRVHRGAELLGTLFVDPFARKGKRGGAWLNGRRPRWRRPDGSVRTALGYLVTNFAPPSPGQPPLLRHDEVVTLFHEFGHALHFLLCEVDVLGVSGFSGVEWDAVELPSQLMENFAWQWALLQRISTDPVSGRHLPRELFDKMVAARRFQAALDLLRQIELALFDLRLHAEAGHAPHALALMAEVRAEVAVVQPPAYNRFPHSFNHVFAGGYAAGYYSYLWAEVLSADAWEAFAEAGITDASTGRRYLEAILARGGSRSMRENFEAFRGRPPAIDALLRQRGLAAAD